MLGTIILHCTKKSLRRPHPWIEKYRVVERTEILALPAETVPQLSTIHEATSFHHSLFAELVASPHFRA